MPIISSAELKSKQVNFIIFSESPSNCLALQTGQVTQLKYWFLKSRDTTQTAEFGLT